MIAIIVAGGSSRRLGFDKLTADLCGRPVLAWSLLAFEACPEVERIFLVAREDRLAELGELAAGHGAAKLAGVIPGGGERHLSVWNGLQAAQAGVGTHVAVHDAARPLITPGAISACLELAQQHGGAACAAPVADTLKKADGAGLVSASVEREGLWAMQTPQIFLSSVLESAYKALLREGALVTDEVSAVQRLGIEVALYANPEPNFKITHASDLDLARALLAARQAAS